MNILILTPFFPPHIGGVETVAYKKAIKFSELGHNVVVITSKCIGEKRDYYKISNISIHRFKAFTLPELKTLPQISNVGFMIKAFFKLPEIIKKYKIQIIYGETHVFPLTFLSYFLNIIVFKRPMVISVQGRFNIGLWAPLENIFDKIITKHFYYKIDKIICSSTSLRNRLLKLKIKKEKLTVIPNGVDTNLFKKIPNANYFDKYLTKITHKKVLFVGRLDIQKGVEYLIKAIPIVIKNYSEVHFFILGNGYLEEKLKSLALTLNISNQITFLNNVPLEKLPYVYSSADYLCLPSLHEGFPSTIVQALSIGLVIIASNVEGIPDVIKKNENGFIVEPGNVEQLSKNILVALTLEQEKIDLIIKKNIKLVKQKYSWEIIISQLLDLFKKIVEI